MKTMLVIGAGRFGEHLTKKLHELGNEVLVVDKSEERIEAIVPYASSVKIADCTKEEVLNSIGARNFDVCFVCVGNDFQSSLMITNLLKEMGCKKVVSRASRDLQEKFLLHNGADEVVYPEKDIAQKLAVRYSMNSIFDYVSMTKDVSIFEVPPLKSWIGKSILELKFRSKYEVAILAVKVGENIHPMPAADHVFRDNEHLIVMGKNTAVERILKQLDHLK